MMVPEDLIRSLQNLHGFDEKAFRQVHLSGDPPASIRLNTSKWAKAAMPFDALAEPVPWSVFGRYLPARPVFTLDPLLHAGAYYVQEASSMFLEQAIKSIADKKEPMVALDLCAAPGGKSTHLLSLLPQASVLVSNEVIQSRVPILLENLVKWGDPHTIVTQNDPADFGKMGPLFDVMVVDAPCSGSGLFRRDPGAIGEWSLQAVEHCSRRQQRILADALPALKAGGHLIYATCSYSPAEDEQVVDRLQSAFGLQGVDLAWPDGEHGVVVTRAGRSGIPCYRFFPDRVKGEGFFMAVLQKQGDENPGPIRAKPHRGKMTEFPDPIRNWLISADDLRFFQHKDACYAMPPKVLEFFTQLRSLLTIRKAGVKIAEEVHRQFNPVHDLALSYPLNRDAFQWVDVSKEQALSFLRKDEFALPAGAQKGWAVVAYQGFPLGWVKHLGNRSNNYYPKDWRIRMKG
ncbi:MAG TPA: hypothetical protein VK907_13865 [Phnomibacter sp.]|nr:hypothetical protein [Phnomibacter sp.]